jgi:hypothetical protein
MRPHSSGNRGQLQAHQKVNDDIWLVSFIDLAYSILMLG